MNRVYKLVWNRARNMYIAVSEIAKSHRKETLRGGKKSAVIFLVALYLFGTGFVANTVQAESNSPVLTDEQKNEIADKVLEKLNSNENLSKKIKEELFKYTDKLVFAGGVVGKKNSPSDTAMAFGNGAFANGYDAISFGYQADAFSEKAVSIGARASTLYNGDVAIGNQTHVAGLSAAVGSGTQLYANQSVALGTQITIVDPEVLELYKKYNYTNPNKKGAADVPSWYWREQIIKNTPEIQDFEKRYAGFLKTLDEDGLQPTYRDELYKQKLIETILWEKTTKKIQKATAVGFQSGVKVTGGVALGAFSNATRKSEVIGYNPNGEQYQNVADVLVKNNKKEAYVKALQEQETLEEELSDLEKQRKSLSGEKYREISEKAYEKNKESKKASKKVNDLYNAWVSVQGAASVGNEETGMTRQITGVAAGSEDTDAVNVAQLKALNNKIEQNKTNPVKYISINSGNKEKKPADDSDNSKNDGAYGANSVAIGRSAKAAGQFSIALGFQSKAWNEASLSIGRGATTFNQSALAIGHEATALHIRGTAVGYYAVAGRSSIAVGPNGQALGMASVALGEGSYVGDISFREAYKKRNNAPYYYINEVIAKDTEKWENYKNKFKEELKDLSEADAKAKLIALIMSDLNKEVKFSTAIGNQSIVGVSFGTALGYGSRVNSEKAVALGADSLAERSGNPVGYVLGEANSTLDEAITSVGLKDKYDDLKGKTDPDLPTYNELKKRYKEAVKPDDEKQALKDLKNWEKTHEEFLKNLNERKNFEGTWKGSSGVVSVGNKKTGMTRQITGVAAGSEDTDAVNVAQMKVLNTKVDNNRKEMEKSLQNSTVKYFSINPEIDKRPAPADHSDNSKNDGAYGGHSIAIGGFAKASEENAIALGWSAKALDINSLAIGNMIYSYGSGSHVVGNQAAALADDASAFGYQAKAMDMGATALGNNSMAIQNGSTAVGYQSLAAVISTAVGANSFALGQASLALGPHSYTGDTTFRDTYTKYNEEKGNDNNVPGYYIGDLIKNNDNPQIAKYKEQFKDQLNGLDAHNQEALLKHLIIADLNKQVQFATAVGNHSTVGASGGTALGSYSAVTGEYGTALGYNSRVTKKNGTALGYNSTVSADYGVALGNDSIADRGMRELGYNLTSTPWTSLSDLAKHGGFQDSEGLLQKDYKAWVEAYAEQGKKYREWNECSDLLEKDRLKDEYEDLKKKTEKAQLAYGKRQAVWRATEGAVSVGNMEKAITRQIIGVAAGSEDTDAVNVAQLKAANSKIEANTKNITNLTTKVDNDKVKYFSVNPEYKIRDHADVNTTNEKNDGAIGKHSMAIGIKTVATGLQALSIGYGAVSEQQHGVAIGLGAEVSDKNKFDGLAIGNNAVVTANFGTAIGQGARVETDDGVAIGVSSLSYRRGKTPGYNPNMTTYTKDVTAYISNDIKQLIEKVKPLEQKERELRRAYQNETDPARKELADKAYQDWTAQHPELKEMQGKIEAAKAVWEDDCGTVSFGNDKLHTTSRLVNVTAGLEDSDAVNVAQLKALNKKVEDIKAESGVHYVSVNKEDDIYYDKEYKTNYDNTGASAKHSVAVGYKAAATVEDGVALGSKATAAVTAGKIGYLPGSTDSTIDGVLEKLQLKEKYAELKAKIEPLQAEYKKKLDAFDEARKDPDTMDGEEEDYQKWVTEHPDFMTALKEFNAIESTWKSGAGAISVGDKENGVTRQITNLVAGTEDTDAVNVAQLKVVNTKVDKNTKSIIDLTQTVNNNSSAITELNKKITNTTSQSNWILGVGRGDDSKTDADATAEGTETTINTGDRVTLKAGRGVKLKQNGTGVQIGLKFIDMDPAGYPFNDAKASGGGSLAIGQNSIADGHQSTAIGLDTSAKEYGFAAGTTSSAAKGAVAIGSRAIASGEGSIAIGEGRRKVEDNPNQGYRKVDSDYAIAIGDETAVDKESVGSVVVGTQGNIEKSNFGSAYGYNATLENSNYATALGIGTKVINSNNGTALGVNSMVTKSDNGIALGNFASVDNSIAGLSVGSVAKVNNAIAGTAIGNNTIVKDAFGAVAIGFNSMANRQPATLGYNPSGEQWTDFNDFLVKNKQKEAYEQAVQENKHAEEALAADKDNAELREKVRKTSAAVRNIFNTWRSTVGVVSIGNEEAGFTRQLIGVAAGTKDTDAVNVAQLKALATAPMGFDVGGKVENNVYTPGAKNWTMPLSGLRMSFGDGLLAEEVTDKDGKKYTLVKMSDEITIGKDGKDGKIGLNGKDGKSAEIIVGKGEDGVDGTNGKDGITRIIYKDQGNQTHEVATLDDGLKFKGDNDSVVIRKLNTQLNITGGATATDLSENNIGVVGTSGDNGGLAVKLSKKLTGLTSAEFKDGDNITNITGGNISLTKKVNNENKTVNLWDLSTTVNNLKCGFTLNGDAGSTVDVTLGDTPKPAITFKAETKDTDGATSAFTVTVDDQKNVTYTLNTKKLKEEMGLTKGVGSMSSWNLKATGDTKSEAIADGNTVEFTVETADKGLTVKRDGKKIQYGINADKLVENINSATTKITNVDGDNIDLSKNTSIKTINENITKMAGKATKVTVDDKDDNSDDADASLKITSKTVDGQTTYNLSLNDKITIGKDGKDGKIGLNGKDGKSAEITVGKGKDGVDGTNGENGITRIIYKDQGNQSHEVATLDDGLKFKGDNNDVVIRKLNTQLNIKGGATATDLSENNIGVVGTADADGQVGNLTVKLSKNLKGLTSAEFKAGDNVTNITAGDVSVTRKEGNENKTVNLWDLSKTIETNAKATKVTVNGKDDNSDDANANLKIKKTDTNGQLTYDLSLNDEITIGKAGEDGKDGKIGLNGKDGHSAEITVGKGKDGIDGTNGENGITRIIYKDQGNQTHEVATLDDGLKFKGDNNDVVIRKLNTQLNITGGAAAADLSDGNIGVVGTTGDNGGLAVKLSKNLKGLTSAEFKDGDNITNITGGNISITKKVNNQNETKNIDLWDLSTTVNNFKGGFTIKDAASGTANVTLGDTNKPAITFKAATEDTDGAASALTAKVDADKNVTYTLNTKKLKEEMGLNNIGTGTMSSWKLKVGTESTDISNGDEVTFAASTDEAAKGLSVKKEGNVITYGINKSELVGNIAGDIITEINKTTNTTKITNVDWSKFPGINFYTQGSVNNGVYTPGASADNKWSSSHIVFGDGIKVEKLKDKDNNQVTRISLDGTGGTGKNRKDGKSAYEIWRDHEENGNQPNKDKTEKQFLESLKGKDGEKGKDGANGKDGKDGTIADIQGDDKSGVSVTSTTEASKKTYTIGLGTKIKAGEVTIDGTKDKENAVVGDVKINGEKGKGTITGLSNKIWDVNKIVSGRAATEDQLKQATQNMQNYIYEIGKHMNGIAASNAALAGLHPLEYDEDDKWNLSAAIGNYKGANAFALGAFYQPNERTLLSIGGTLAGEEHLLNVGLSLKTGPGTSGKVYASRTAMAREIQKLKEKEAVKDQIMQNLIKAQKEKEAEIKALQEKDAQREKQIRQLMEMVMELKK